MALRTTAVTRLRPVNSNRGPVFSTRPVPRCYNQGQLAAMVSELLREPLGFSCCDLLLSEVGSWGREPFGNLEEGERPPLEAATKQRLVKTWLWTLVCVCNTEL
jgi:hypothetical protein